MTASVVATVRPTEARLGRVVASIALVFGLAWLVRLLDRHVPEWLAGLGWVKSIEFPVYAIAVGLLAGALLGALGLRERLAAAVRTELYIKTGLVLLGASINLAVIAEAAVPAIAQSVVLITTVFLVTWALGGLVGLEPKLRAVLAAGVSICGVSAAIAAAGAVAARREQLAYVASLVILFALPSIFVQPWLVDQLGVPEPVAGAWIGGNIDTTAAVTAAGAIVGEGALKIAAIVKQTQNAMMGLVAFLLTVYFVFRVERRPGAVVGLGELWTRFPKFILGFLAASAIATVYLATAPDPKAAADAVRVAGTELRTWAFILAFVCIGLEFRVGAIRAEGIRPVAVFAAATVINLVLAFVLANVLFAGFRVG
ncbi:MAG TPA: putative sulfate exporter family transporter [Candidatus Binatia bacterium]|nr:putative sulfate exporter family transporter [Candidatus Binatia bacterium]